MIDPCEGLDLHVAAGGPSFIASLERHGADEAHDGSLVREDPDDIGTSLHTSLFKRSIGLIEGLADCGDDDSVLAARDVCQSIAHPMDAPALPGRLEDPLHACPEAAVGVADHQLGARRCWPQRRLWRPR